MEAEYTIRAYEKNQISLYAILGEANSRTIIFNIIEKSGTISPTSNAIPVNQMLDLTGMTAEFVVFNGYKKIVCSGTITDAQNGVVSFLLTPEISQIPGKLECVIELTNNSGLLRIVGITLNVQDVNGFSTINIYRNTAFSDVISITDDEEVYILGENEKLIFEVKHGRRIILQKELTSVDYDDDEGGYIISLTSAETDIEPDTYYYNIKLQRSDGEYEPVIFTNKFIIRE